MSNGKAKQRTPFVAGNWKMNMNPAESAALVREMLPQLSAVRGVDLAVCPPFTSLSVVKDVLQGSPVMLGAQNMYWEEKGAYTGEISPLMLAPLCDWVILGHSERRQYFGETDETVNRRIKAALAHNLKVIFCVGENLAENEAGQTEAVVTRQVRGGLADVPSIDNVVIAYEPVWAIGTGRAATAADAARVIGLIRRVLGDMYGADAAQAVRIQYGGSVTAKNAAELMAEEEIDGALVGGASLKAADFVEIARAAAEAKAKAST